MIFREVAENVTIKNKTESTMVTNNDSKQFTVTALNINNKKNHKTNDKKPSNDC